MMPWVVIFARVIVAMTCLVGSIQGRGDHRSGNSNIGLVRGDGHTAYSNLGDGLSLEEKRYAATQKFKPYTNNGGMVVAIAGRDYVVMGAGMWLVGREGTLLSRKSQRLHEIVDPSLGGAILAVAGCLADANGLLKVIHFLAKEYQWKHRRPLTVHAMSHLLGTQLYMRRQLPYYSFCILGGIDTSGMGAVYQYDSIGSFERTKVACAGGGLSLIQPVLDRIGKENTPIQGDKGFSEYKPVVSVSCEEAIDIIQTAFRAAAGRDVSFGDLVELAVIQPGKKVRTVQIDLSR